MNISREQYHRFLTNQCSEEERLLFTGYLEQHPEMLEQWLQAEDWEQFNDNVHLHPAFSARMRDKFLTYINGQQQQRRRWYRSGIAAAAVVVIAWPVFWLLLKPASHKPMAVKTLVTDTLQVWQETRNTADSAVNVLLNDHSLVKLYAHSALRYQTTMTGSRRDVYLQGVAHFAVAKDAHRPFTVYAGGIATTALGTAFRVTAKPGNKNVQVKLYEGKVVVKPADAAAALAAKPVYLLPGDEVVMTAAGKYDLHTAQNTKENLTTIKKNNPVGGDTLSFANMPLTEVLEQLKQKFGATIHYDATAIKTIYITASFTEQDTLSNILNILCTLNNLQLQGTGTVYTISR